MAGVAVMVRDKYAVRLAAEQREELQRLIRVGKRPARVTARARILLKSDDGWTAPQVAEALDVALGTVYRVEQRFTEEGLSGVLKDRPQANWHRKLDDRGEAHPVSSTGQALIALACSPPPAGHDHWTLRLLADKVVELKLASSMSHEGGAQASQKNALKPWQKKEWCIPKVSAEFVANMEDLLDLYTQPYDPRRPVVCFDETSTQLLAETRPSLPPRPGIPVRQDYEYRREGVRNLFLACEPLAGWRHVAVTQRRTMEDFAHRMRRLVDEAHPETPVVRVVMDNPVSSTGQALNTHRPASLYESFPEPEARRIAKRLEFHYTPKHGSWLNMAEIEFSVLSRSCLKQRLPDEETLHREVQALVKERNAAQATIHWRFNTQDARTKLHRLYPFDSKLDSRLT